MNFSQFFNMCEKYLSDTQYDYSIWLKIYIWQLVVLNDKDLITIYESAIVFNFILLEKLITLTIWEKNRFLVYVIFWIFRNDCKLLKLLKKLILSFLINSLFFCYNKIQMIQ